MKGKLFRAPLSAIQNGKLNLKLAKPLTKAEMAELARLAKKLGC